MKKLRFKNNNNNGFTLVEVMVALVLLLIMSLGTLMGLSKTMQYMTRNQYKEEAKSIAQLYLDEALATPYADLVDVDNTESVGRYWGESAKNFQVRFIVETLPTTVDAKSINVDVSWQILAAKAESISMQSIRGNR